MIGSAICGSRHSRISDLKRRKEEMDCGRPANLKGAASMPPFLRCRLGFVQR
jgi:hypothetical protein